MTIRRAAVLTVCLLIVGLVTGCGDVDSPFPRTAHSVVLIDIGGASARAMESFAGDGSAFASLDDSGARFDFAFAQSSEPRPALASLLTGLYPGTHGVKAADSKLDETITTLPQAFRQAGFATAAFSTAGDLGAGSGLDRGFDQTTSASGDQLSQALSTFLDQHSKKPFFLMLHTDLGYALGSSQRAEKIRQRLQSFDAVVQLLQGELDERGLKDHTTLLITADRGIGFESETATRADVDGAEDRATDLQIELQMELESTHVPLRLTTPGLAHNASIGKSVEIVDVMPTLLDLAGVEIPGLMQGVSLRRLLEGSAQERFIAFSELRSRNDEATAAVSLSGYQLVQVGAAPPQLYDLRTDAATDIAALEPHKVTILRRHLESWRERMAGGLAGAQTIGSDELDALQNLGYIQ